MQSQEIFNLTVSKNLTFYRKLNNLTQLDLAEKLNYSDKAISKWERGECLPDVYTLNQIASLYNITINDLVATETAPKKVIKTKKFKPVFITILSSCLVWLVATAIFVLLKMIFTNAENLWLSFIFALPINFIVLIVFTSIYRSKLGQFISVSGLIWTAILSLDLCLNSIVNHTSLLYIIGIPMQVAVIFWYCFKWYKNSKKS